MGVSKTLVLNIERAQYDYLPQGICGRCIEYFLYDGIFFINSKFHKECVSSLALLPPRNFESQFVLECYNQRAKHFTNY